MNKSFIEFLSNIFPILINYWIDNLMYITTPPVLIHLKMLKKLKMFPQRCSAIYVFFPQYISTPVWEIAMTIAIIKKSNYFTSYIHKCKCKMLPYQELFIEHHPIRNALKICLNLWLVIMKKLKGGQRLKMYLPAT